MKFTFALALLAAVSAANGATDGFINWAVANGKGYNNVDEFGFRKATFLGNQKKVQGLNAKNAGKNVRFADNFMSDMTDDEFVGMLGLGDESDSGARLLEDTVEEGRLLEDSVEGRRL